MLCDAFRVTRFSLGQLAVVAGCNFPAMLILLRFCATAPEPVHADPPSLRKSHMSDNGDVMRRLDGIDSAIARLKAANEAPRVLETAPQPRIGSNAPAHQPVKMVLGLATGIEPHSLQVFAQSLRTHVPEARIVIFTDAVRCLNQLLRSMLLLHVH